MEIKYYCDLQTRLNGFCISRYYSTIVFEKCQCTSAPNFKINFHSQCTHFTKKRTFLSKSD